MENPQGERLRPVVTPDDLKEVLEPISISRLGTLASCQPKWHLKYRQGERPVTTAPHFFVGGLLHNACEDYYDKKFDNILDGAIWHLREKFRECGVEDKFDVAMRTAEVEAAILDDFASGAVCKPDGTLYTSPKMTKIFKERAASSGLYRMQAELRDTVLGNIEAPHGLQEIITRILMLAERYQNTILVKREKFEWLETERGFDFVIDGPSGNPIRFLGFLDVYGRMTTTDEEGHNYNLIDYKSGKAHEDDFHQMSSHSSLQLTLYWYVLTQLWGVPEAELKVSLHYLDAAYAAETTRTLADWDTLLTMADGYYSVPDAPGFVKRLFYDGDDCVRCEMRSNCIGHFGQPTTVAEEFAGVLAAKK